MSFARSLAQGRKGEDTFHKAFPTLIRSSGRFEDFIMLDGRMIELKCESRSTLETPNLALELNSSEDRPGAIERAANDGMAYIIYLYSDGIFYVYKPIDLLSYIYSAAHRTVMVRNSTYRTLVMLVPRASVKHLEVTALFAKEAV